MDHILTDETRLKLRSGYHHNLSASGPETEETQLTDGLPLNIDVFVLRRIGENTVHAEILIEREDHPELVVDRTEDCPHYVDEDRPSTLTKLENELVMKDGIGPRFVSESNMLREMLISLSQWLCNINASFGSACRQY